MKSLLNYRGLLNKGMTKRGKTMTRSVTCTYYPHSQTYEVNVTLNDAVIYSMDYPAGKNTLEIIEAVYGKEVSYAHA